MKAAVSAVILLFLGANTGSSSDFAELATRAAAARDANDLPRAIALYREALAMNPKWDQGWWYLGSLSYDADQYAGARDALLQFVRFQPDAAPAWALLGLSEFETAEYTQALAHIRRSLSIGLQNQPQMQQVLRYHEAMLLTRTGEFDKALQEYTYFVAASALKPDILVSIGLATLRTPLLPKEAPPAQQDLFITAGRAAASTMKGDVQQAQESFRDLITRFPDAPNVHYAHGLSLLASDSNAAISEFKRELQITPSNAAAGAMLAWVLLRRGDYQVGLLYAVAAARSAPEMPTAQFVLGRLLVETGSVEAGIQHLEEAKKLDPNLLEVHLSLATAYSRTGRKQDARRERQIALDMTEGTTQVAQK